MVERISRWGSRVMPSGLVRRITRMDRRIGLAVAAMVPILFIGALVWVFVPGGDGNGNNGEAPPGSAEGQDGLPLDASGVPLLSQEEMIAESVAATIAAMPTATPEPTPDVAATLQAQLAFNRGLSAPVVELNPLDLEQDRDPYLSPAELEYFRELGPRLWIYTQVWFHVRRVISVDVAEWDADVFGHDLERANDLLSSAPERSNYAGMDDVGPVVRSYADSIEDGMSGVSEAVGLLSEARSILEGEEMGPAERSRLFRLSREVEVRLGEFDRVMSAYGCSICGELFRQAAGE